MSDDVKEISQEPRRYQENQKSNMPEDIRGYRSRDETVEVIDKEDNDLDDEEMENRSYDIMKDWMWLFSQHSHMNEVYGIMSFHVFLGQMLKDVKVRIERNQLDGRINFFLVQDSSSGKSAAFKLLNEVGEKLDIDVDEKADFSDASAIGGFDYDVRKKLIRDMKQEKADAPDSTEEATEEAKSPGFLEGEGIITCDEGKQFISGTKNYGEDRVENLQRAMNPLDSGGNILSRDLKHGRIECESQKSFLVVTYPPANLQEKVLETGLFQRMLLYVNRIRYQEWMNRFDHRADNINEYPSEEKYDEKLDAVVQELEDIREKYSNYGHIEWTDEAKEEAKKVHEKMMAETEKVKEHVGRHLRSFISRYINHTYVMSVHYCAMRRGEKVKAADVKRARKQVAGTEDSENGYAIFSKLAQFLSESTDDEEMKTTQDEVWDITRNHLSSWLKGSDRKDGYMKKKKWKQYVRNNGIDVTDGTLDNYIKEWEGMGKVDWEKAKGGNPALVKFYVNESQEEE